MNCSKIGILTSPLGKSGILQLSHLIQIMNEISNNLFVISDDEDNTGFFSEFDEKVSVVRINQGWKGNGNRFTRIICKFLMQLRISFLLFKLNKNYILWIK